MNLSHEVDTTTDAFRLTPTLIEKCVTSDRVRDRSEILVRMAPTLAPFMARINVYTHNFAVPRRLLNSDWDLYTSGGKDGQYNVKRPTVTLGYLYAVFSLSGIVNRRHEALGYSSLLDYFGWPVQHWTKPGEKGDWDFSALADSPTPIPVEPFLAYQKIYDDYYRDENFIESYEELCDAAGIDPYSPATWSPTYIDSISEDDRILLFSIFLPKYRAWEQDYFTSALPWAQRGPTVSIDINGQFTIPRQTVLTDYSQLHPNPISPQDPRPFPFFMAGEPASTGSSSMRYSFPSSGSPDYRYGVPEGFTQLSNPNDMIDVPYIAGSGDTGNRYHIYDPAGTLYTAGSSVPAVGAYLLMNDLRRTMKVQEFFELRARAGYRLPEVLYAHFGVRSSDARLQRAEYIGGGRSPIVVSEVIQSSASQEDSPQGNRTGIAASAQRTHQFSRFFNEPVWVIQILSIMPKPQYMDGVRREFYQLHMLDEYWPSFGNIGEQPIQNWELYFDHNNEVTDVNDATAPFGYTPRYAEYKFRANSVHGLFRGSLNFWHAARSFSQLPVLGSDFVMGKPQALDRLFAVDSSVPDSDRFWIQIYHKLIYTRPMSKYGTPHF